MWWWATIASHHCRCISSLALCYTCCRLTNQVQLISSFWLLPILLIPKTLRLRLVSHTTSAFWQWHAICCCSFLGGVCSLLRPQKDMDFFLNVLTFKILEVKCTFQMNVHKKKKIPTDRIWSSRRDGLMCACMYVRALRCLCVCQLEVNDDWWSALYLS